MTQHIQPPPLGTGGIMAVSNVIAFPERAVTRAARRRAASELRDRIANWVNEGGAGEDVNR
jgi:hypothetical protein